MITALFCACLLCVGIGLGGLWRMSVQEVKRPRLPRGYRFEWKASTFFRDKEDLCVFGRERRACWCCCFAGTRNNRDQVELMLDIASLNPGDGIDVLVKEIVPAAMAEYRRRIPAS